MAFRWREEQWMEKKDYTKDWVSHGPFDILPVLWARHVALDQILIAFPCCISHCVCVFHTLPLSGDALVNKQIMGYANCMDLLRRGNMASHLCLHTSRLPGDHGGLWDILFRQQATPLCLGKDGSWNSVLAIFRTWGVGHSERSEDGRIFQQGTD